MQMQIKTNLIDWAELKRISPRITFDITVGRSFPAYISRINEDGANIKIDSRFEAGSRRYTCRFDREGGCQVYERTTDIGWRREGGLERYPEKKS